MATHDNKRLVKWRALGAAVRIARQDTQLTLRGFARAARIDKASLCRAEAGKPLTVENYFAICMALGLDPWDFIKQRHAQGR